MIEHKNILAIDRAITSKIVALALAKGYSLSVYPSDDDEDCIIKSRDAGKVLEALHSVAAEQLYVHNADGKSLGWIFFVFGESGWDVICDHTTGRAIMELVDTGPIKAMTDGICETPDQWQAILAANA